MTLRGAQSPGYFIAATITLALAIAAAGAIIGAVHGLLLGSIGIQDPARLVIAWETHAANAQRAREFALRLALGAETRDIARTVLTSVAQQALPGLVVGLAVAAAASHWMSSLLFHTHRSIRLRTQALSSRCWCRSRWPARYPRIAPAKPIPRRC